MDRHYIIGPCHIQHSSLKINMYGFSRKQAAKYATSIGRELAEGPALFIPDNYHGPVELWPLVIEEVI